MKRYREFQLDRDIRLAWHVEAFQRTKKLPELKTLMSEHQSRDKTQTVDEQRAVAEQLRAMLGVSARRVRLVRKDAHG